ncbi:MAG: hypothetical protein OXU81_18090 [Gammaproteobacteria bacterium]|nr:hypothetical protein [Gammaproteobacteria bacterium]
MQPWINFLSRYTHTAIDFWRLQPKYFIAAIGREPDRYLAPYPFFVGFLGIEFVLCTALFTVTQSEVISVSEQVSAFAQAAAVRQLALITLAIVLNAVVFRALSRVWPIKGSATFRSVFAFQCYMSAIILPLTMLDLLVQPVIVGLNGGSMPEWGIGMLVLFGLAVGGFGLLFRNFPGIAYINGVSTTRVFEGYVFWSVVVGVIIGVAAVVGTIMWETG